MINTAKNNDLNFLPIAGMMPNDSNIEFVGVRNSKTVLWIQHGSTHYFKDLPDKQFFLLLKRYLSDKNAVEFLSKITSDKCRQVELYTYYTYGDVDGTADIIDGELSPSENFRDKNDCPSLLWNTKQMTIGDYVLSSRQLFIIDCIRKDLPNKAIADLLGITLSTFDFHMKKLYDAIGVQTKPALLAKAFENKVIR